MGFSPPADGRRWVGAAALLVWALAACTAGTSPAPEPPMSEPQAAAGGSGEANPDVVPSAWTCSADASVAEDASLVWSASDACPGEHGVRIFAGTLPPGARWDAAAATLTWTPDAFQAGDYVMPLQAWTSAGQPAGQGMLTITVTDARVTPALREVRRTEALEGTLMDLEQVTDAWLDARAGSVYPVQLAIPAGAGPDSALPLRVFLHGFNGVAGVVAVGHEVRVAVADPANTYWYGTTDASGVPQPFSQRRVLHVVSEVLRLVPGIDPDRVYLDGASMGGTGAATLGLMHARHFAWVHALIGQNVPRNHRPTRLTQLQTLWGPVPAALNPLDPGPWDGTDLTHVLATDAGARDQWLVFKHGKDDAIIHFGAMIAPSPLTGETMLQSLAGHRVGHVAAWDEGGHGTPDPTRAEGWWMDGWWPADGQPAVVRNALTVIAAGLPCDGDPGSIAGDGSRAWDVNRGFAGSEAIANDSGWGGDAIGAVGRGLRWDSASVEDEVDRFAVDVWWENAECAVAGAETELTVRRLQWFRLAAGESVACTAGPDTLRLQADADGLLSIPIDLGRTPVRLRCERQWGAQTQDHRRVPR
jgi:hypothetical protein